MGKVVVLIGTKERAGSSSRAAASAAIGRSASRSASAGRPTRSRTIRRRARCSPAAATNGTGRPSGAATTSARPGAIRARGLTYGDDGPTIKAIWEVKPAHGAIYAGVEPAGLFRSDDGGATWQHVSGPARAPLLPGVVPRVGGGLCLPSIVPHPTDPAQMWVGMSAVGTFHTADGGTTWTARNKNVRADFLPTPEPEFGPVRPQPGARGERLASASTSRTTAGLPQRRRRS
jgi:hypothetical protein